MRARVTAGMTRPRTEVVVNPSKRKAHVVPITMIQANISIFQIIQNTMSLHARRGGGEDGTACGFGSRGESMMGWMCEGWGEQKGNSSRSQVSVAIVNGTGVAVAVALAVVVAMVVMIVSVEWHWSWRRRRRRWWR